jgi:hypothetical protein
MMKKVKTHRGNTVGFLLTARVVLAQSGENTIVQYRDVQDQRNRSSGCWTIVMLLASNKGCHKPAATASSNFRCCTGRQTMGALTGCTLENTPVAALAAVGF